MSKANMLNNINRTLKVAITDGREVTGKLLVYDQHMNVVLGDCTETRPQTKKMKQEGIKPTRELGLILLRGEHVLSVTVLKDDKKAEVSFDKAPKAKEAGVKRAREE